VVRAADGPVVVRTVLMVIGSRCMYLFA
jgi:hypothetical protein